ncbi:class I tRNA ligase family protein, partial [Staphylococcus epidermidis]|uniref:class I tRNA ligase family protein n=1 Tax=Staphylococcus epidermidis TaxID=1282 RepID=UPI0021B4113B
MNHKPDKYKRIHTFHSTNHLLKHLKQQHLLIKIEQHTHSLPHSQPSPPILEPYLSTQSFLKMKP